MKRPNIETYPTTHKGQQKAARAAWRATGLTQTELARRLGVDARQVRHYMNGTRRTPFVFVLGAWALADGERTAKAVARREAREAK